MLYTRLHFITAEGSHSDLARRRDTEDEVYEGPKQFCCLLPVGNVSPPSISMCDSAQSAADQGGSLRLRCPELLGCCPGGVAEPLASQVALLPPPPFWELG